LLFVPDVSPTESEYGPVLIEVDLIDVGSDGIVPEGACPSNIIVTCGPLLACLYLARPHILQQKVPSPQIGTSGVEQNDVGGG
jgi:hypothetical protein